MTSKPEAERTRRLMLMGNIPLDLTVRVPRLPRPGEDVQGESAVTLPGGGFNVLHAAWRGGLLGRYAGTHGTGPFGDHVREALADIDCEVLQPPLRDRDSGWVVALVDATGERTFVSSPDAVVAYDEKVLESLQLGPSELVYVSGYSLGLAELSVPLASWVAVVPREHQVFFDLGPWGAQATPEVLGPVLQRVDWLSCNAREARQVSGALEPADACAELQGRTDHAVALVRVGAQGCWVASPGGELDLVPAPVVPAVLDTTGAGDTHSGAFLAAVAAGAPVREAVVLANAAAARAVTNPGGAFWRRRSPGHRPGEEAEGNAETRT
jgi:sugar/nucleoside kinase (ribokinase family)